MDIDFEEPESKFIPVKKKACVRHRKVMIKSAIAILCTLIVILAFFVGISVGYLMSARPYVSIIHPNNEVYLTTTTTTTASP